MRRLPVYVLCLMVATAAVACSKSKPPPDPAAHTLFQSQIRALNRARGVQQTLDAADRRERRAIERQSQ